MNWAVLCHLLTPFSVVSSQNSTFSAMDSLFLLDDAAADRPNAVYVTDSGTGARRFSSALIVSIGEGDVRAENHIRLSGGSLTGVFNTLLQAKHRLDALDGALARCETEQAMVDEASRHLNIPLFYLDNSYRILAISRSIPFEGDAEWHHMTEKGFLSPESARTMQHSGDLDMLAAARGPIVYHSRGLFPWTSVVCNVHRDGVFFSRLNMLCTDGDTSPLRIAQSDLVVSHLTRLLERSGRLPAGGPLQNMLTDLLHGVHLSEELIADRLKSAPYLSEGLMMVFYLDVNTHHDHQIASYYAALLKRLYPEEVLRPIVFEEQLVLLAHAAGEAGFDSLIVNLAHFFATYRLRCGVSNPFSSLRDLRGYFQQAVAALKAGSGEAISFYRDIMLEQILSYIPHEHIPFLISRDIARLQEAEARYSFSLVDTLKVYLECNCNLGQAAERLFVHKNTLLYRLNHIRAILRCDLNDADERLLLMLSFKLLEREEK